MMYEIANLCDYAVAFSFERFHILIFKLLLFILISIFYQAIATFYSLLN